MATLNIRNIPPEAATAARNAARARNMNLGQYVAALVQLHASARAQADSGDRALLASLKELGLETKHG